MEYRVAFHPRAARDLNELADYVTDQAGAARAAQFIARIKSYCLGFRTFPKRGTVRDDIAPGVRMVGFRRQVSIVFVVKTDAVHILGIFYGGRNVDIDGIGDEL